MRVIDLLTDQQVLSTLKKALFPVELSGWIDALNETLERLPHLVEEKDAKIVNLEREVLELVDANDLLAQYSRRPNLRFEGIPEADHGEDTDCSDRQRGRTWKQRTLNLRRNKSLLGVLMFTIILKLICLFLCSCLQVIYKCCLSAIYGMSQDTKMICTVSTFGRVITILFCMFNCREARQFYTAVLQKTVQSCPFDDPVMQDLVVFYKKMNLGFLTENT